MSALIDKLDFWQWAYSDFRLNAQRGVLAEYMVAKALDCADGLRDQWNAYDLITNNGIKIEVKSSSYLQSWEQTKPSQIRFDIAPKHAWQNEDNKFRTDQIRSADVYIFCVFASKNQIGANELDVSQWFFLVCSTDLLNKSYPKQKTVGLSSLEKLKLSRIKYEGLKDAVYEEIANQKYVRLR